MWRLELGVRSGGGLRKVEGAGGERWWRLGLVVREVEA